MYTGKKQNPTSGFDKRYDGPVSSDRHRSVRHIIPEGGILRSVHHSLDTKFHQHLDGARIRARHQTDKIRIGQGKQTILLDPHQVLFQFEALGRGVPCDVQKGEEQQENESNRFDSAHHWHHGAVAR